MISFESRYEEIRDYIRKRRNKWQKLLPPSTEFEDVEQVMLIHIYRKWHLWDQARPMENWVNTVISNQMINVTRKNYMNYAKPCINCPHNLSCGGMGEDYEVGLCSKTTSGAQDSECDIYAEWEKTKKHAFNVKIPVSYENYGAEIAHSESDNYDYAQNVERIKGYVKPHLNEKQYKVFEMLYFENLTDEEVAIKVGYKTREKGRKAGYAQIANLKKKFKAIIKEAIKSIEND